MVLPDRAQVTMAVPFMRAYTRAAGADLPPARRARDRRHGRVHPEPPRPGGQRGRAWRRSATTRSASRGDGFDGTWVAHPDLVPVATEIFDGVLGDAAEPEGAAARGGRGRRRGSCSTCASPAGGSRRPASATNVTVALQYLDCLAARQRRGRDQQPDGGRGDGRDQPLPAVAVAPPRAVLDDGRAVRRRPLRAHPRRGAGPARRRESGRVAEAAALLDSLVLGDDFPEFLTLEAYGRLD